MRIGHYAVVEGHEYQAHAEYRHIWIDSATPPEDQDGWEVFRDGRWRREVQQSDVTSLVHVTTLATFDSHRVNVLSIDHRTGKVAFVANPGPGPADKQLAHPPHSELSPILDNAASIEGWYGEVEPHRLTDIHSSSEELDVSLYGIPRGGSAVVARTRTVEDLDLVRSDGPHGA